MSQTTTSSDLFRLVGRSARLDAISIARLAVITDDDVRAAVVLWRRLMPGRWKNVLQAEFNTRTAKYELRGNPLGDDDAKKVFLLFLFLVSEEAATLTERMLGGFIQIGEWQILTAAILKSAYIAAFLFGIGGQDQFRSPQRASLASELRFAFGRLEHFSRLIEERTMPRVRTERSVLHRIGLYSSFANQLYETARREAHEQASVDGVATYAQERNVLGDAEHCPQCLEEDRRGWVPIGALVIPGQRICRVNCKCRLIFR